QGRGGVPQPRRGAMIFEQPKNPFGQKGPTDQGNTNRKWLLMRKNPLNKGIIMENAAGIGTATSEMVEARAREVAATNGHPSKPSQRSEEHTSELQSQSNLVCRLLLEK